ncbi:hypothetical protein M3182_14690 [Mesobacillus maritimus]|uniref:hypothetical protein n=1 Tax=Mesobacillus maritimus TaxID=1643336 RepID=UPI00203B1D43|nr:hypothetical protein [Mesobacillus maritimus]MCM3586983.1 hypothetical protein [Mesobacillus maritimus]
MWEKIEIYFFDIMGLLIPGLIFLTGIIFTTLFLISEEVISEIQSALKDIVLFKALFEFHKEILSHFWLIVVFYLVNAYLLGHVIKVISKVYYWMFRLIFDEFINKMVFFIYNWGVILVKKITNYLLSKKPNFTEYKSLDVFRFINEYFRMVKKFIIYNLKVVFVFKTEDYEKENKVLLVESMKMINKRFNTKFPEEWYSVYKLAKIIIYHESIKNMNDTFLAKYNFYRSMSFISFIQVLVLFICYLNPQYFNPYSNFIIVGLLIINFVFWYTFHEKFKRYFKLCGNETLVSIYYYLKSTEKA